MTKKKAITAADVREMREMIDMFQMSSLDRPLGEDNESTMADMLVAQGPSPEDLSLTADMVRTIHEMLATLPERDKDVLEMRFGINRDRPMTMDEVGQKWSLSRERVRQIENAALDTLRHPSRLRKMRAYSVEG